MTATVRTHARRIRLALLAAAAAAAWTAGTAAGAALPQQHEYQKVLRAYMGTLTEKDFDHGLTNGITVEPCRTDPEYLYRNFVRAGVYQVPLVGSKRGVPAVNNPPSRFLLSSIEGTNAILRPLVYPEALMALAEWDYPGNVYRGNRALKLRCFVTASINLMMLDDYLDKTPSACRADWRAYQLVIAGSPYPGFRDLLPPEVQRAYEAGLMRLARRIMEWGPKREEAHLDLIAPLGLWYAARACRDAAFSREVESYARTIYTDPRYFHPAGYWIDHGGLDVGFSGQANVFAIGAALAAGWPFAREAVERVYRLRAHLTLPEPDGTVTGPCAFNVRLSSAAHADQWEFGWRDRAALMLTDEAACWVKPVAAEALAGAPAAVATEFNRQIAENPVKSGNGSAETPYVYFANAEIPAQPWACPMWPNWQFPVTVNFGYDFYRKGSAAHLAKLERRRSPFLSLPFSRPGTFVRNFDSAFVVARRPAFGVILHTGPVGAQETAADRAVFPGPLGFGGGQLSAFWTPAAGSVILGRRGGMNFDRSYDDLAEWRLWPIHAVSGVTAGGRVFTSARIVSPQPAIRVAADRATAVVQGSLMALRTAANPSSTPEKPRQAMYDEPLDGRLDYARTFTVDDAGVRIETVLSGDGREPLAELCETIPVYLRDDAKQASAEPTAIEFEVGGRWTAASDDYREGVTAVRLTRFGAAVRIAFDGPRRVRLSPAVWKDPVPFAFAACRNVMVDLLAGAAGPDRPAAVTAPLRLAYEIAPLPGPARAP